jgi:TonB family protein
MKSMTTVVLVVGATLLAALGTGQALANGSGKVYTLADLNVVQQVAPRFPQAAARGGFEGWVDVEFTVAPDGSVSDVEVSDSSSRVFHREALSAISNWRFEPVQEGGRPVPVRAVLRFTFRAE